MDEHYEHNHRGEARLDRSYMLLSIPVRLLVFTAGTVLVSVLFNGLVKANIFSIFGTSGFRRLMFCLIELVILGAYWYGVFRFSKVCRHLTHSMPAYYGMSAVVAALFALILLLCYRFMDKTTFLWLFRVTMSLRGVTFNNTLPSNYLPYLIAFLLGTFAVMMLEPTIARQVHQVYVRRRHGDERNLYERMRDRFLRLYAERSRQRWLYDQEHHKHSSSDSQEHSHHHHYED